MGFFRFRRSIKLLPGVRWNFGKRSSSLSIGPRGAHVTFGSAGTRTTVGIPGTGLSYTEFHAAHHKATDGKIPMPSQEWINAQSMNSKVDVPDRKPDELSIRPDQIDKILEITKSIDEEKLQSLGEHQADHLISDILHQQQEFTERKLKEYLAEQGCSFIPKKKSSGCFTLIGVLFLIGFISSLINRNNTDSPTPSSFSSPTPIQSNSPTPEQFPSSIYWPKEVRLLKPTQFIGLVGGGTINTTIMPGTILPATISDDHKTVTVRQVDLKATLPIGDTDFLQRAIENESRR